MVRRRSTVRFRNGAPAQRNNSNTANGPWGPFRTLLANWWSYFRVSCWEFQPLQVGGSGPVQRLAGPPGVEPDQVDGGGCGVVFQAGLGQAEVAGAADAGDVGGLGDGAFHPGADPVPAPPGIAGLPGAGGGEGLVDLAGAEAELAAGAGRGGAPGAGRAGLAGRLGEPGQDGAGPVPVAGRGPGAGDGALRAGDLLVFPVDGEHGGGVAAGAGLRGAIGRQRGEQGDAAGAGGQQQRAAGIPAVGGVLAGRQAAPG